MIFKNITKKEVLEILQKNGIKSETNLTKNLKNNRLEDITLDDKKDLPLMSNFFTDAIPFVINKIISTIEEYKSQTKEEIVIHLLKEKEKLYKHHPNTKLEEICNLEIIHLFLQIFPAKKMDLVIKNLKKIRSELLTNKEIKILQLDDQDFPDIGTAFVLNRKYKFLNDIIFIRLQQIDFINLLYFFNENLYAIIFHELSHLIIKSKDIKYYVDTASMLEFPYFINPTNFNSNVNDISINADSYVVLIFTAAIFVEMHYSEINLKNYNKFFNKVPRNQPSEYIKYYKQRIDYLEDVKGFEELKSFSMLTKSIQNK